MNRKRVVVAMSGGVDSSVCAALLKDRGFEVIGITMQIWPSGPGADSCCSIESLDDAKRVAYKLKIPHYLLNFRDEFKKKVIVDFCNEYKKGRTPNPCIRCNQYIKFDLLLKKAKQLDADYIATGHYAKIEYSRIKRRFLLKKGQDARKDQSYVLYTMTQDQLKHTLLPLGNLTKDQVRKIARKKRLPTANKAESQEICFISDNNYPNFLKKQLPSVVKPGDILNTKGGAIGKHQGVAFYTIGQRRGIGIAAAHPLYVVSINNKKNAIVVGSKQDAYKDSLTANRLNLIMYNQLNKPIKVKAKVRYLHTPASAVLTPMPNGRVQVKFTQPQFAITPGQAVVFYKKDIVLGGGQIE